MQPLLSICIPTYNRQKFLKKTLDHLIPQLNEKVEVIVFDNASTDETPQFLQTLLGIVSVVRQQKNIGADRNMMDCLQGGSGKYIWLLCDDDLPYTNAVDEILKGIESNRYPPFFFLTVKGSDSQISDYNSAPSIGGWTSYDRNSFLNKVGCFCTFAPSLLARRDCLDINFIKSRIGSYLVPAAAMLSTVGKYNIAYISDNPLIFARSDNSGGYSTFTVFTKQFALLLRSCKKFGYGHLYLNKAYEDALRVVILSGIDNGKRSGFTGSINLLLFTYKYKFFYKKILYSSLRSFSYRNPVLNSIRKKMRDLQK